MTTQILPRPTDEAVDQAIAVSWVLRNTVRTTTREWRAILETARPTVRPGRGTT